MIALVNARLIVRYEARWIRSVSFSSSKNPRGKYSQFTRNHGTVEPTSYDNRSIGVNPHGRLPEDSKHGSLCLFGNGKIRKYSQLRLIVQRVSPPRPDARCGEPHRLRRHVDQRRKQGLDRQFTTDN